MWVEGLAGIGKTFVIQSLRHTPRNVKGRNSSDLTSAPTGCAAKILSAKTYCRSSDLPTGSKLAKAPANDSTINLERLQEMRKVMTDIVVRIFDEHSMNGRSHWVWLEHKHQEHRRPVNALDSDMNILHHDISVLSRAITDCLRGGLPKVISFGYHA